MRHMLDLKDSSEHGLPNIWPVSRGHVVFACCIGMAWAIVIAISCLIFLQG